MKYIIPGVLLLLCILSFAPLIPWLGFYWDDWPAVWFFNSFGPGGFQQVFAVDRPLLGWLFQITTPLMRESTTAWQIFGIFSRWVNAVALWWFLRILFPRWSKLAAIAAALCVVYPGFSQQYVSVTYSHGFILSTIFIISLGLMVLAARDTRGGWFLLLVSLLLSGIVLFTVEYYFGLELLRPVILWIVFSEKYSSYKERGKRTLLYWSPYFLLLVAFLLYTIFIHETPRGQIKIFDILAANPISGVVYLLGTMGQDFLEASFLSWIKLFDVRKWISLDTVQKTGFSIITLLTACLTYFFVLRLETYHKDENEQWESYRSGSAKSYMLLGFISILVAGWPFWATDLQLKLRFPLDRFTLPMIIGASLLTTGIVEYIFKSRQIKALVIGILVGLAAGTHFLTALSYVQEWDLQKEFFRQLTWRAPGIKPSTLLLTPELPFTFYSDNSLTAPLNWIYDPTNHSADMSYLILDLEARLGNEIKDFSPRNPIEHNYRAKNFSGRMSDTLLFTYQPPRCLAVYDPEINTWIPESDYLHPQALPLSNLARIDAHAHPAALPPENIFGPEPHRNWCYYFQKAGLARQKGDWERVAELGDQAGKYIQELDEDNIDELLPFIEGYAHTGRLDRSIQLSERIKQLSPKAMLALCGTWDRIQDNHIHSGEDLFEIEQYYQSLQCENQ